METVRTLLRPAAALILTLYLAVGTLGLLSPSGMGMAGGIAPACPTMGHDGSLCPMTAAQHLIKCRAAS